MKRLCAAGMVVGALTLTTTACVDYREEWHFDARGAGRVVITCEPSAQWRAARPQAQWEQMTRLFVPRYAAISQACAQAGVRLERCRWQYDPRRQLPAMEVAIAFDAVPHVARCSLFAGRELHWRRNDRMITLLHAVRAYDAASWTSDRGPLPPEWFADGRVTIITHMPGRIVQADGGKVSRTVLMATASLNDLASGTPLEMLVKARLPWRWWWLVRTIAVVSVAVAGGGWLLWRYRTHRAT